MNALDQKGQMKNQQPPHHKKIAAQTYALFVLPPHACQTLKLGTSCNNTPPVDAERFVVEHHLCDPLHAIASSGSIFDDGLS